MRRVKVLIGAIFLFVWLIAGSAAPAYGQIGKYVPIPAGSDADHALTEINAATDPAQKLTLIDKFAKDIAQGDLAIIADDLYVNYYIGAKDYDKAIEYGEKLFALDPDNFNNAVNMVHAAAEKGDTDKAIAYGEKTAAILKRYKDSPPPEGKNDATWDQQKKNTLDSVKDSVAYVEQLLVNSAYQTKDPAKRAGYLLSLIHNSEPTRRS